MRGIIMNRHRPFIKAGYLGLSVIAMSIVLLFIFPSKAPSLPEGFITPIIAFEFIQSPDEVFQMFGGADLAVQNKMVDAMDLGNRLDYVYMCLYSMFLLLFSTTCAKIAKKPYYYAGAVIALAVLAGDAMENIQLLGITENLSTGDIEPFLGLLYLFTWIKWGGLALVFLILSPWFFKGGLFSKTIGALAIVSFILGIAAFLHRSIINEIFALSVALMFILMIIYCFISKTKGYV
jgi:hypothetical protein